MPYIMNDTPKPRRQLKPWFPAGIKPARDGAYQVRLCPGLRMVRATWRNGGWWIGIGLAHSRLRMKAWPEFQWRGLARQQRP
jgi:hypothetical protein